MNQRQRRPRPLWAAGAVIASVAVAGTALAIHAAAAPGPSRLRIPVFAGPPPGVPPENFIGPAPGNPNSVPSRIVVLRSGPRAATTTSPPISGTDALGLARQQLGPAARPMTATATLETFQGALIWDVAYTGICAGMDTEVRLMTVAPSGALVPAAGPSPRPSIDPASCRLSVAIDAESGAFISASSL